MRNVGELMRYGLVKGLTWIEVAARENKKTIDCCMLRITRLGSKTRSRAAETKKHDERDAVHEIPNARKILVA